jgi:NADH-quinone oxidoreductase subunit M
MTLLYLILIPLLGGVLAWIAARRSATAARWISLVALALDAVLLLNVSRYYMLVVAADSFAGSPHHPWILTFHHAWIPQLGISLSFAMDGLSLLLIFLTLFLGMVSVAISWTEIRERVGFFHFNLMWVLAGIIGVFTALDLFLFAFFWELMLIPMYFLIAIWGHENRAYAATKFFLFTQLSGLLMLLAILALYFIHGSATGNYTFDYTQLLGTKVSGAVSMLLLLGFLVAFAVKLPAFPLHTWLPDAHTEAPTAGSVILAGLLLKTGAYGMMRFAVPLFPDAAARFAPVAMALGVVGIIYGAVLAFAQTDFKRLVAYTSVSHMGFVLLGVFAWNELALQGAVMQMLCHGIATGALFILAGALQERIHTRDISRMGGFWSAAPRMGGVAMFFAWASLGLPGLGNFVAEFLTLLGSWQASRFWTILATSGLIASTVYALWIIQSIFHGPAREKTTLRDLGAREMTVMALLIAAIVWLGVYPQPVLDAARPALTELRRETAAPSPTASAVGDASSWITAGKSDPSDRSVRSDRSSGAVKNAVTSTGLRALLPPIILSVGAILVMLFIALRRNHLACAALTLATLALAFLAIPIVAPILPQTVTALLLVDKFALFYMGLVIAAAIAVVLFSYGYLNRIEGRREEFYVLLLLATAGAALLAAANHFASFLLALEILSVALYGMLAFTRSRVRSIEAGLKYLILAATSSAFLLFGMALVYLRTGSLAFPALAEAASQSTRADLLLLGGVGMIIVGFGFKLAVVPFHMWTADVYEGAPAPATGFIATVSKGAVFALLLRFFSQLTAAPLPAGSASVSPYSHTIFLIFASIAVASMFVGNLLALRQANVKRILAYSSIAHLGYLLVAFLASGPLAPLAVTFYLTAYFITTLGTFGVVSVLSCPDRDADDIEDYRGLAWRRPWLAAVFMAMLFSLAGIPLTAGFVGKFSLLAAGVHSSLWLLAVVLVVNSTIGLYYYLRIVAAMLSRSMDTVGPLSPQHFPALRDRLAILASGCALAILVLFLVWLGVHPGPWLDIARAAVSSLP